MYSKRKKCKELNKIRKSIQNTKIEFKREIELLKKNKTEIILEMKNSISQNKSSGDSLSTGMHHSGAPEH